MEKYPELTEIANKLGLELLHRIHEETSKVESKMEYKFQYVLEDILGKLEKNI